MLELLEIPQAKLLLVKNIELQTVHFFIYIYERTSHRSLLHKHLICDMQVIMIKIDILKKIRPELSIFYISNYLPSLASMALSMTAL